MANSVANPITNTCEKPNPASDKVRSPAPPRPYWGRRLFCACSYDIFLNYLVVFTSLALVSLVVQDSVFNHAPIIEMTMFLFLLRDYIFKGRAMGKHLLGLKIIDFKTGKPPALHQSIIRNLIMVSPFYLFLFISLLALESPGLFDQTLLNFIKLVIFSSAIVLGIIEFILINRGDGRRMADFLAGTMVVNGGSGK